MHNARFRLRRSLLPTHPVEPLDKLSLLASAGEGHGASRLSSVLPFALLCLICLVLYFLGLASIPPVDRDEARFAQATRQMLETRDFVRIRFQDEERNKKPVGIHWLQAAAVSLFSTPRSTEIWPYRLPSVLAATLAVLLTAAVGASLLASRQAGFIAAVLLASSLGLVVEAHLATPDAALLAAVVAGQAALGLAYIEARTDRPPQWRIAAVFWVSEAIGILLKGPMVPAVALLTVAALAIADRDIRWLKALRSAIGVVLAALITVPWLVAVQAATAGHFLLDALGNDFAAKLIGARESHGAPFGSYLSASLASSGPVRCFSFRRWPGAGGSAVIRQLASSLPGSAWILFELMPTKLPHYVLPLYPVLALLAGAALAKGLRLAGVVRLVDAGVAALWAVFTVSAAVALAALPICLGPRVSVAAGVVTTAMIVLCLVLLRHRRQPLFATGLMVAICAAFVVPGAIAVVPALDALWLSRSAAKLLARHPPQPGKAALSVGYHEPSLVFLIGTTTRLVAAEPTQGQIEGAGMALVSDRDDATFRASLATRGVNIIRAAGQLERLHYSSGGGRVVLSLYELE